MYLRDIPDEMLIAIWQAVIREDPEARGEGRGESDLPEGARMCACSSIGGNRSRWKCTSRSDTITGQIRVRRPRGDRADRR